MDSFARLACVLMTLPFFVAGCVLDRSGTGCASGAFDARFRCVDLVTVDSGQDAAITDGGRADADTDGMVVLLDDASLDASFDAGYDADVFMDDAGLLDSGFADASLDDSGTDAGLDAGEDAGFDAGTDAGFDAGFDAGMDAGHDAGMDGGTDAGFDAGTDAGFDAGRDAGRDAGFDAGFDAGMDAGFDAGTDAGFDAGSDAGPPPPLVITFSAAGGPTGIVFRVVWNEAPPIGRRESAWYYRNCDVMQSGSAVMARCNASELASGRTVEFFPFNDSMMSASCNATTCPSLCSGMSCPGYPGAYSATYLGMSVPPGDFVFNTDPTGSPGPAPGDSAWISFPLP